MDGAVFTVRGRSDATATSTTPYDSGSAVELRQRPRRPRMSHATFAIIVRNHSAERRSVRMASVLPRAYQRTPRWTLELPLALEAGASATVRVPIGRATCVTIESSVLPAAVPHNPSAAAKSSGSESGSPLHPTSPSVPLVAAVARIDDGAGDAEDVVEAMIAGRLRCVAVGPGSEVCIGFEGAIACAGAASARPAREESALAPLRKLARSKPLLAALLRRAHQPIVEIAAAALAATAPLNAAAAAVKNDIFIAFYALVLRQVPMHRPLSTGCVNVDTVCFEVNPLPFLDAFATAFYAAASAASAPSSLRLPPFVDLAFPAAATSVASRYDASEKANRKYAMIAAGSVWRRPGKMCWAKQHEELEPRLKGVVQGERAGNCWLCSMLASLAESVPSVVRESLAPWPSSAHVGGSGTALRDASEGGGGDAHRSSLTGAFSVRLWIDGASRSGLAAFAAASFSSPSPPLLSAALSRACVRTRATRLPTLLLNSPHLGSPRYILVDDLFPAAAPNKFSVKQPPPSASTLRSGVLEPVFQRGGLWAMLVEKAFAKWAGCWQNLRGGMQNERTPIGTARAVRALTNAPLMFEHSWKGKGGRHKVERHLDLWRRLFEEWTLPRDALDEEKLCRAGAGAGGDGDGVWVVSCAGARNVTGLKKLHAYSLLGCCAVPTCGCAAEGQINAASRSPGGRRSSEDEEAADESAALLRQRSGDARGARGASKAGDIELGVLPAFAGSGGASSTLSSSATEPAGTARSGALGTDDAAQCAKCNTKFGRFVLLRNPTGLSIWKGGIRTASQAPSLELWLPSPLGDWLQQQAAGENTAPGGADATAGHGRGLFVMSWEDFIHQFSSIMATGPCTGNE